MKLKLIEKKKMQNDTISFIFEAPAGFNWKAGQFMHYTLPHENPDERKTERWFTISSAPFEKNVVITTRISAGNGSTFKNNLVNLPIGSGIDSDGPEGDFVLGDPSGKEFVFIAGGIGITPYHSILMDLDNKKMDFNINLIYANRTADAVFKDELNALALKHKNLKIHYIIDPDKLSIEKIKELVPDFKKPVFYLSGPEPMVESFEKILIGEGIAEERLIRDYFPGYTWPLN